MAVDWASLYSDAEGNFNAAIGTGALLFNTAEQNTATGAGALLSNTIGDGNTANGIFALFSNTATITQQRKDFEAALAQQQKEIEALTAGLQKLSAQRDEQTCYANGLKQSTKVAPATIAHRRPSVHTITCTPGLTPA